MTITRPKAVIFDIIETVFALEALRDDFEALSLARSDLETWFAFGLRDAFALDATGSIQPFPKILSGALDELLAVRGLETSQEAHDTMFETMRALPAHADAHEAFTVLRQAGIPLYALSNGARESTENLLKKAGLTHHFEDILSVETVGRFKPARPVYEHAVSVCGVRAEEAMLVATHAWDVHGAKSAGLSGAFVARGQAYPKTMLAPDLVGDELLDVAKAIAGS
ncbi:haloacid dehalogenase type II [Fulvimarina endophytica]|uniref:(S)-2-haloacid dehalogenase n=1 Tax=Fulvimarina endophytica TaxID=2293836 RepID=A0A371WYL1_9HYPH|nr:haloacid dehalogenase type II [Fulvimarina endophytica]RFC62058.1 haloacid dehalogenase type II [Fulvimarina endophytica]